MKRYVYDVSRYLYGVTIPGIVMALILIYALVNNCISPGINIYTGVIIICIYGIFNTFISISNPKIVNVSYKELEFCSYGKVHKYEIEEIESIRIREFYNKKIYIRINKGGLLKGRYWLKTDFFNDSNELYLLFDELERKLHPNSLRVISKS